MIFVFFLEVETSRKKTKNCILICLKGDLYQYRLINNSIPSLKHINIQFVTVRKLIISPPAWVE